MVDVSALEKIADELTSAFEASDLGRLQELWAPDFTIWYNTNLQTVTRQQALEIIAGVGSAIPDLKFQNIRRLYGDNHYVQQHNVTGHLHGKEFSLPACIIVQVTDGKVSRVDEWWDSAQDPRSAAS